MRFDAYTSGVFDFVFFFGGILIREGYTHALFDVFGRRRRSRVPGTLAGCPEGVPEPEDAANVDCYTIPFGI